MARKSKPAWNVNDELQMGSFLTVVREVIPSKGKFLYKVAIYHKSGQFFRSGTMNEQAMSCGILVRKVRL